jgi:membrane-associated phospholipid phosphatase
MATVVPVSYGAAAQIDSAAPAVVPGERLSNWLLRTAGPNADTTALHWHAYAERAAQSRLKQAVLQSIEASKAIALPGSQKEALLQWLQALPVTGRVNLAMADARWLQGSPAQDPILQVGDDVVLYPRPSTVTVWSGAQAPCVATHVSGALVNDYLNACFGAAAAQSRDWAWIAQSDGTTRRFGVAPWNTEPQDEPGPGSSIWAPERRANFPNSTSDNLARFLATQPPYQGDGLAPVDLVKAQTTSTVNQTTLKPLQLKASDWGDIGLLQTPTARMAAAGDVRFHLSHVSPYTRGTVMLQPLDWFEAGFRYTDVANRLYGSNIAGSQSYKDKSIDVKLRLREETNSLPQVAVGLRDIGGTGLFSGEYLVANKRWGNWDASLGLGWGYLGARGNLKNPLSFLGSGFDTRPAPSAGQGGTSNTQAMFHGPTALFGGVQWQAPASAWTFKLELDGNDYQHEPQSNNQTVRSPFNLGAVYSYSPNIDFSLAVERGNSLLFGVTLHGGLNRLYSPKLLDPVLPPLQTDATAIAPPAGWDNTAKNIEIYTGWTVRSISQHDASTTVQAETDGALHLQERVERAIRVLHHDAPASSEHFILLLQEHGLPLSRLEIDRAQWVTNHSQAQAPALRSPVLQATAGSGMNPAPQSSTAESARWVGKKPGFKLELDPSYSQSLGGPDGFVLYQIGAQAKLEQRFSDNTWLSGDLNLRVLDNYDKFKYDAPSNLPRVRTYAREYVTTARLTMPLLQLTHVQDIGNNQYLSAYAGMLEPMYAGVGAEWLIRPWQGRLAFGVDVNHVRQRDFGQNFALRDYGVNTGHATLYWDTGWNDVQAKLSVGRYLAGDSGATLDVKRVFQNGTTIGAWATKTNVTAEQFGEGSFDKGIYVNIPFDVMLPKSSSSVANIIWNPLMRDGGARLNRKFNLFDLTRQRDWRALGWQQAEPATLQSAQDTSYVLSEPAPNIFQTLLPTGAALAHQVGDIPASSWLWAGTAVLASSLLDTRLDHWAVNHQTPAWNRVGSLGNNLPLALALSTGLLYTGIAGAEPANTAETALKAGAYTLGAGLLTRYVVGRARPYQEMGSTHFDGFNNAAFQSGFTSNHVSLAFALATPFAQAQGMTWLYGVAALSAVGRIQSRDHWLSDTVGSAFMGYAIGSLVGNQRNTDKGVHYVVTPQSVEANWSFK